MKVNVAMFSQIQLQQVEPEVETGTEGFAIVTVLDNKSSKAKYTTALVSMECYALQNNYTYMELNAMDYKFLCRQQDVSSSFQAFV